MASRRTRSPLLLRMHPLTNGDQHTAAGNARVVSGVIPLPYIWRTLSTPHGIGARDVRMPLEKPCSPGHCLGILNDYMRTDMLRHVPR